MGLSDMIYGTEYISRTRNGTNEHEGLIESCSQNNLDVRKIVCDNPGFRRQIFDFSPEISKFRVLSRKFTVNKRFRMSPFAFFYDFCGGFNNF